MIQLASSSLSTTTFNQLQILQDKIDTQTAFVDKKAEAIRLWKIKDGSIVKEAAFVEVKEKLTDLCVSVEVCNYCEQNEANDIEHIAPKSFFPELTFVWDNYLLACKQCNSGYKLDQCYVLDNQHNVMAVPRGTQPPFSTLALINPRIEDPNEFLILNLQTYQFINIIDVDVDKESYYKAEKTLEILQLNNRAALIHARKEAGKYYYERLERLCRILAATSIQEIETILTPHDELIDETLSLEEQKSHIKKHFKKDIQTHQHPSVWYAIKTVQSKVHPKWQQLFDDLPEALNW